MIAQALACDPKLFHRRRADDRARRHGAGRDPEADARAARAGERRHHPDHPRHGRGGRHGRHDHRDEGRPGRRARHVRPDLPPPAALYTQAPRRPCRTWGRRPTTGRPPGHPRRPRRRAGPRARRRPERHAGLLLDDVEINLPWGRDAALRSSRRGTSTCGSTRARSSAWSGSPARARRRSGGRSAALLPISGGRLSCRRRGPERGHARRPEELPPAGGHREPRGSGQLAQPAAARR